MLSKADVDRLMQEPSPVVRVEVASKLAVELDSPKLSESGLGIAQDVVRLMARDVEVTVRQALAENLRHAVRIPHDVAVRLANDVEAVALPILQNSLVLTDADLIEIVGKGSPQKQEAVAGRPDVSEKVADALITQAAEDAVTVLMNNPKARITEPSLNKAVDRFKTSEAVTEAMVKRPILPLTVTERLATEVSDKLRDYLVMHHEMSSSVAADIVVQSLERAILSFASGNSEGDIEKLVAQMYQNKRLTPSIILRALCMGEIRFFEAAVAVMANVPLMNARILIHDAGTLGFSKIYEKTGLPMKLLPAVRAALDVVHETALTGAENDIDDYRAKVIERVLTQYDWLDEEDANYLLAKLGDLMHRTA